MYRCGRIIGHFTLHTMVGCILSRSSIVFIGVFCELLPAFEILKYDREGPYGQWPVPSLCDNERTIPLWTNALRAHEGKSSELIPPGPHARVGTIQLNRVSSAYCPKHDQFALRRPESTVLRAGVGHQPKAMEDPTAARGARAQGADGVHSASWGNPRGERRAGGRLKPEIKVTIGGDRPPRWVGDVVTFEDIYQVCVNFLLPTRSTSNRWISQTKMEETGYSRGGERR